MNAQIKTDTGLSPLRTGRITGSRVAAVLGLSAYSSREDVLREMVREHFGAAREFTGNDATRYGQAKEPEALAIYERERGLMTYGGGELVIHPAIDFLAVTPDGLVGDEGMIECKAPYRGTYTTPQGAPHYIPQMQLQMACTGRAWCDFAVLQRDGCLYVTRVERDDAWLQSVLPALAFFMAAYRSALAAPDQHLAERDRRDTDWSVAAHAWREAAAAVASAQARLDEARSALLALAGDASAKGCGVQVIRSERAGTVAYAKAIKALCPDADLAPFTGAPSIVTTVKECKA